MSTQQKELTVDQLKKELVENGVQLDSGTTYMSGIIYPSEGTSWVLTKDPRAMVEFLEVTRKDGPRAYATPYGLVFLTDAINWSEVFRSNDLNYFYPEELKRLLKEKYFYPHARRAIVKVTKTHSKESVRRELESQGETEAVFQKLAEMGNLKSSFVKEIMGEVPVTDNHREIFSEIFRFDHYWDYSDDPKVRQQWSRKEDEIKKKILELKLPVDSIERWKKYAKI